MNLKRYLGGIKTNKFVAIVLLVQLATLFLILNPINLYTNYVNKQIVEEVSLKTAVDPNVIPLVTVITDAEALRGNSTIDAEVYKDAATGDYILSYSDTIIVYRRDQKSIVYKGDAPGKILSRVNSDMVAKIVKAAKAIGIIGDNSTETPSLAIITDIAGMMKEAPDFYKDAKNTDIIATFSSSKKILIYRYDTSNIVAHGTYTSTITRVK